MQFFSYLNLYYLNNHPFNNVTLFNKTNFQKLIKITLAEGLNLFFSPDKTLISLTPIIPTNNIDTLLSSFNLKKFNITKEKIENEIKLILTQNNNQLIKNLQEKKYKLNGIDIKKIGDDIKIIDDNFIKDCLIVSKMNNYDCVFNISNKISTTLFGKYINFEYLNNNESQFNKIMVKLKIGNKVLATSDCSVNAKEAKLNAYKNFEKK